MIGQHNTRSSTNQTTNSGSNSNSAVNLVNSGSISTGRGKRGVNWTHELKIELASFFAKYAERLNFMDPTVLSEQKRYNENMVHLFFSYFI